MRGSVVQWSTSLCGTLCFSLCCCDACEFDYCGEDADTTINNLSEATIYIYLYYYFFNFQLEEII